MKKVIKVIVRVYRVKETGKEFVKTTIKGKYLGLALADDETTYEVKFVGELKAPTKEGIYEVAYEDNNLWIDTRPDMVEKNIARCRASKIVFNKHLPKLEKDIRLQ